MTPEARVSGIKVIGVPGAKRLKLLERVLTPVWKFDMKFDAIEHRGINTSGGRTMHIVIYFLKGYSFTESRRRNETEAGAEPLQTPVSHFQRHSRHK